jgi:hypothetical protein
MNHRNRFAIAAAVAAAMSLVSLHAAQQQQNPSTALGQAYRRR